MGEARKPKVLLNLAAGTCNALPAVQAALRAAELDADVRQIEPEHLHAAAREAVAAGVPLVVAAGGDGTIGSVASAVISSTAVLGVLPAGTLNHFARDLGLPPDLAGAARVLATGRVREVDAGDVNGRVFLNNCSIGLYPRMVIRRDGQRHRLGRGKWVAMLFALVSLFRRYPRVRVRIEGNGESVHCETPLVFVGNNRYETDLLNLGRRPSLEGGELWVYLLNAPTRLGLIRLVCRGLLGRLKDAKDFRAFAAKALTIESKKKRLRVATDGEVSRLAPPLVFRVREKALRVMGP